MKNQFIFLLNHLFPKIKKIIAFLKKSVHICMAMNAATCFHEWLSISWGRSGSKLFNLHMITPKFNSGNRK
uniref:Uncharacterized protein n=1 Tax=Rhizophora mucronata TaxID=61149 RepID=A0A2P2J5F3_RHIMU